MDKQGRFPDCCSKRHAGVSKAVMAGRHRTTVSVDKVVKTPTLVPDAGVSLKQMVPTRQVRTHPASEESQDAQGRLLRAQVCLQEGSDVRSKLEGLAAVQEAMEGGTAVTSKVLRLIACALEDVNFAVVQGGLEALEELVERCGGNLRSHLDEVVGMLVPRLGGKYAVRQSVTRTFLRLMECVEPKLVLQKLMTEGGRHRSSRIREDTINVVLTALLMDRHAGLDLLHIAKEIAPSLTDSRQRVRQAALEGMALLSHFLGVGGAAALSDVVASVEESYLGSRPREVGGVVAAFKVRVARKQMPSVNADGLVDHVVQVAGGVTSKAPSHSGPDVDWILQGSVSSNPGQNSPSVGVSRASSGVRPYNSAGTRSKLPWERDNERNASKLASLPPPAPKKPLPSLQRTSQDARMGQQWCGPSKRTTSNSYAELHRVRLRRMNMDHTHSALQSSGVSLPSRKEGERLAAADRPGLLNGYTQHEGLLASVDVGLPRDWSLSPLQRQQVGQGAGPDVSLSRTWPSTRSPPHAADSPSSSSKTQQRPSSKPRVKHPLRGLQAKLASAAEESEVVQGHGPFRRAEDYDDDFEDIFEDQFEGSSLSSSVTSFGSLEVRKAAQAALEVRGRGAWVSKKDLCVTRVTVAVRRKRTQRLARTQVAV